MIQKDNGEETWLQAWGWGSWSVPSGSPFWLKKVLPLSFSWWGVSPRQLWDGPTGWNSGITDLCRSGFCISAPPLCHRLKYGEGDIVVSPSLKVLSVKEKCPLPTQWSCIRCSNTNVGRSVSWHDADYDSSVSVNKDMTCLGSCQVFMLTSQSQSASCHWLS